MGLVTLGMALALLEELYMAILPSDKARDQLTQTLMLTTVPTAMEDMPMDLPMATDTGVDISMERDLLILRLNLILVVTGMPMVSPVDIPMFPGHLLLDMDVNAARPTERPMMKL